MMVRNSMPDINTYSNAPSAPGGNVVIFAKTAGNYFYPEHATPFLFLTNFMNKGEYVLSKKKITVSDKSFCFLNPNDTLEINFKKVLPLQTLMILFEETFFKGAYNYFQRADKELLESPNEINSSPEFPKVPFDFNDQCRMTIKKILQHTIEEGCMDEILVELVREVALVNQQTAIKITRVKAVKKSTREELYRRLWVAKEFMEDHDQASLTIEKIAREACLNKFHFLTTFKNLFNVTPNQYLMKVRLEKAYHLLKNEKITVTEACHRVGYESLGSFSNAFTKRFKIPPSLISKE